MEFPLGLPYGVTLIWVSLCFEKPNFYHPTAECFIPGDYTILNWSTYGDPFESLHIIHLMVCHFKNTTQDRTFWIPKFLSIAAGSFLNDPLLGPHMSLFLFIIHQEKFYHFNKTLLYSLFGSPYFFWRLNGWWWIVGGGWMFDSRLFEGHRKNISSAISQEQLYIFFRLLYFSFQRFF